MKKKDSQVTISLILGIVLLIAIVSSIFIVAEKNKKRVLEGAVSENKPKIESFNGFVTDCLSTSLENGLVLMGKQGGYLYVSQGSNSREEYILPESDFFLSYLIINDPNEPTLPVYPCRTDTGTRAICGYYIDREIPRAFDVIEHFGMQRLPPLEDADNSIQEQLRLYVQNKTFECINEVDRQLFEFQINNVIVVVNITNQEVISKMNLDVTLKLQDDVAYPKEYVAKSRIPLRSMYEAINETLYLDTYYPDFFLKNHSDNGAFLGKALKLKELNPKIEHIHNIVDFDDLIKINFTFYGREYIFQFLRENRKPFLDWGVQLPPKIIGQFKIFGELATDEKVQYIDSKIVLPGENYVSSFNDDSDFVIEGNGQTLYFIPPPAWDPDEDNLSFWWEGWFSDKIQPRDTAFLFSAAYSEVDPKERTTYVSDGEFTDYHTIRYWVFHFKDFPTPHHRNCEEDCGKCRDAKAEGVKPIVMEIPLEKIYEGLGTDAILSSLGLERPTMEGSEEEEEDSGY